MKNAIQRLALMICIWSVSLAANATPISISPADQTLELGEQAQIDIMVNPNPGEFIGGFELTVNFDSSILSVASIMFGDSLNESFDAPFFQDSGSLSPGTVFLSELSFLFDFTGFQNGDSPFLLGSILFDTMSTGTSNVTLSNPALIDDLGFFLDISPGAGVVRVEAPVSVDEPGTLALLFLGLFAVALSRRKRTLRIRN